ncbi:MAG: peptide-methionine (S)-S-oxide reductase MsrA [Flavobacteriales bacterium]|nr:peptide-methionine (S)-S-oxide reductase MsrA [Flavobacteriales bacterium]
MRPALASFAIPLLIACTQAKGDGFTHESADTEPTPDMTTDTITLGAGCFWCVEAVFTELRGVLSVTSGYMGGHVQNPSYREVCAGTTGHAEVARVVFDPSVITVDEILEVFWQTHDPTTLNRQGADVGTQYRSAIFWHTEDQRSIAESYRMKLDESGAFSAPIVTEIAPATVFYEAENYHQDYYALNGSQGYCQMVIRPKLEKFRKVFAERLKR